MRLIERKSRERSHLDERRYNSRLFNSLAAILPRPSLVVEPTFISLASEERFKLFLKVSQSLQVAFVNWGLPVCGLSNAGSYLILFCYNQAQGTLRMSAVKYSFAE